MRFTILTVLLVMGSLQLALGQVVNDTINESNTYPPQQYENLTPKESWELHKAAYIKQLKSENLSSTEYEKRMQQYEANKQEFFQKVGQQQKLASKLRKTAAKQRKKAAAAREVAARHRALADLQRNRAEELSKQAEVRRSKASEQRERATELRKQAESLRTRSKELRKLAAAQRAIAEQERQREQAWRKNATVLLDEQIQFTKSKQDERYSFKVVNRNTLKIEVSSRINKGKHDVEIFDPSGKKVGELNLNLAGVESQKATASSSGSSQTNGQLDKTIENPALGTWTVKSKARAVQGRATIRIAQLKKASE
ncbi:MAG: hypothetical protein WBA16_00790 [Nonlabens sp.]